MGFLGTLGKIAGGVGGFALGGPAGAAAGYSLASGLDKDHKAGKLDKKQAAAQAKQVALQEAEWGRTAPARNASLANALKLDSLRAPDLSSVYSDPGNPYNRVSMGGPPPPTDLGRVQMPSQEVAQNAPPPRGLPFGLSPKDKYNAGRGAL